MSSIPTESYQAPIRITAWRKIFIFIMKPILKSLARINVENIENLPIRGGAVLAVNHLSFFDGFILQYAIPRPIYFMGKAEAFRNPLLRFFMYQIGAFPVERGVYDRGALQQARRVLECGQLLGMFPEGTRTYGQGMVTAKSGVAHLAMQVKCPIVPIAMQGSHNILKHFPIRTNVIVKVCRSIYPKAHLNAQQLTDLMMRAIARELPRELRGVYA